MARSKTDDFDGYRKWLGISNEKRLPTHYELLAISLDEDDPDVIQAAAEQRRHYVESKRGEGHDDLVTEILYRIDEAESTLLNTALRRDYDRKMDLFEKRRKNRQVDPIARRSGTYRGGRTVGEDGGIFKTFAGIVAIVCVAFGCMAWFAFRVQPKPAETVPVVPVVAPALVVQQPAAVVAPPQQATKDIESPDEATAKALKTLQGEWLCTSHNHDGKQSDEVAVKAQKRRVSIHGDNFDLSVVSRDGTEMKFVGKMRIYPNEKVDFVCDGPKFGEPGITHYEWPGIYEVKGDTLKLHFWKSLSEGRPTDFVPVKGNLETYVRQDTTTKALKALQGERPNGEDARWKFWDVFRSGAKLDHAMVVSRDGVLVSSGQTKGVCLASLQEFSDCNLKLEFQFPSSEVQGNPYFGIASSLPNPDATEWTKQIPRGIEIKLNPNTVGQLVLPTEDFKVELKAEQARDAKDKRKINPVRMSELKFGDWNSLEINVDEDRTVTVMINGTIVNQLGAAQSITGHVIIWAANSEMRVRNVVVGAGGAEAKLSFNRIE